MLIIVFGLPGSGKTFFAKRLCDLLHASYLGSDQIRYHLTLPDKFSRENKNVVYDMLLSKALKRIHDNETVVVDATFYKNNLRHRFSSYFNGDKKIFFIEILANEKVIHRRLDNRTTESEADYEVYKQIKAEWEPALFPHLVIESTDDNIDLMLKKATEYLASNHVPVPKVNL